MIFIIKKILKYSIWFFIFVLLGIATVPYLFELPETNYSTNPTPFSNSQFLKVDGTLVHYRTWKPDTGSIKNYVFLVHGFSGSTYSFQKLAPLLIKNKALVIAVDLPGFGFSDKTINSNFSDSFKVILSDRIMSQVNSKAKWILVGHSMGAKTVALIAQKKTDKVSKIVLIDGLPVSNSAGFFSCVFTRVLNLPPLKRAIELIANHFLFNEKKFNELLFSAYGKEPSNEDVLEYLRPFQIQRSASSILEMMKCDQQLNSIPEKLKSIPKMLIWGGDDQWIPINEAKTFLAKNKETKFFTLKNAGHCPMETHPNETLSILLNFFDNEN